MAKYKITATAMVTLEKEIEASSEREAEDIFYSDTYEDIMDDVDNSDITDINTDSVESNILKMKMKMFLNSLNN